MMKLRDAVITAIEEDEEVELDYREESDKGNFCLQCYLLVHSPLHHDENVGQDLIMETSEGGLADLHEEELSLWASVRVLK